MANSLIFHNPGEIDIRGACIAGLSAKATDSAIGYFGTGLKYSIACILRWGGSITIYSGTQRYDFRAEELDFRGQSFKQVVMHTAGFPPAASTNLGFTTAYGKDWQPWQVFRELYANARDEGGGVRLAQPQHVAQLGWTHIIVSCEKLTPLFYSRDEIILPADKTWQQETDKLQFNLAPSSHLYYRGVRVADIKAHHTWNFTYPLALTEDRTVKTLSDSWFHAGVFLQRHCTDESTVEAALELSRDDSTAPSSFERDAMQWLGIPRSKGYCSETFCRVACRLYARDPVRWRSLRSLVAELDISLIAARSIKLTSRETTMLARAKELVALFGFEHEIATLPISIQELGGQTLGLYEHGTIALSPKLFDQGMKQLVATLYEECYHHRTAQCDCTYSMQTDLFNIIVSLNEELHNVIC